MSDQKRPTRNHKKKPSAAADALRAAGYRRLPGLWVTHDELMEVRRMAFAHADKINQIRREVLETQPSYDDGADPRISKEAAWDVYLRQQRQ